jgi:hypothetical protein
MGQDGSTSVSVFGVDAVHSSVLETLAGMVETHCDRRRMRCAVAVVTTVGLLIGMGQQSAACQASKVPGIESIVVSVELSCPSCAQGLERRLGRLAYVDRVEIHAAENEVLLTLSSGQTFDLVLVRDEFRNAGFIPDAIVITAYGEVMRADGQAVLKINDETVIPLVASDRTTELMKLGDGRFVTISGAVDIQSDGNQLHVQTAEVL